MFSRTAGLLGIFLLTACKEKPSPAPTVAASASTSGSPTASALTAKAIPCAKPAAGKKVRYVGSHTCTGGGGSEDGSQCEPFEVRRLGRRTIVRPLPAEFAKTEPRGGTLIVDDGGPLRVTDELQRSFPEDLRDMMSILSFRTFYAGSWPEAFFLVSRSLAERPRLRVYAWEKDRWGRALVNRAVSTDAFPEVDALDETHAALTEDRPLRIDMLTATTVTTLLRDPGCYFTKRAVKDHHLFVNATECKTHKARLFDVTIGRVVERSFDASAPIATANESVCVELPRLRGATPGDAIEGYVEDSNGFTCRSGARDDTWIHATCDDGVGVGPDPQRPRVVDYLFRIE